MSRIYFSAFACLMLARLASGQAVSGTIVGTVTDSSGAVVPSAKVTILEANTNQSRTSNTNESGNFAFVNVPQGSYNVSIEQTGFRKATRENVEVTVNSTVRVDLQLQPGQISEQITVAD